jgi:hypothetical protein
VTDADWLSRIVLPSFMIPSSLAKGAREVSLLARGHRQLPTEIGNDCETCVVPCVVTRAYKIGVPMTFGSDLDVEIPGHTRGEMAALPSKTT